jgi:hypothetical protein
MVECAGKCICISCALHSAITTGYQKVLCNDCLLRYAESQNGIAPNTVTFDVVSFVDAVVHRSDIAMAILRSTHNLNLVIFTTFAKGITIEEGNPLKAVERLMWHVFKLHTDYDETQAPHSLRNQMMEAMSFEELERFFHPVSTKYLLADDSTEQERKPHLQAYNFWGKNVPRCPPVQLEVGMSRLQLLTKMVRHFADHALDNLSVKATEEFFECYTRQKKNLSSQGKLMLLEAAVRVV